MINESELNISNLSYTNKDFETAYAEILDIATKMSNRWNPTNSNESDPGVVLLKLLAFFVDKLNYNVDKNTLENFLLSCTQESSMRDLCEMNGYSPRYYNAATTDLSFMYTGYKEDEESEDDALEPGDKFVLKAFTTSIEDSESNVSYVLMQDVEITEKNREVVRMAMEGSWKMITVEGSEIIRLSNLDDNHRIYFPVANVAENGVRIFDTSGRFRDDWQQVKNLNTVVPGTKAYKFGFDSIEGLPYLEFTDDISQLIGSGIEIGYVITSGVSGNVKANYLTQLKNETEVTTQYGVTIPLATADSECLSIVNRSASINGANPETINEAYNSFKKIVGTFDTLVTCRDYANAIYNLMDEADLPIVSNIQVSDRRSDINYAKNILTHDEYGTYIRNKTEEISAFDVCLYPLKPIKYVYNPSTFNESFLPLEDKFFQIEGMIEDQKTLSHTYKEMSKIKGDGAEGIIYLYKVYYKLVAKITTKYKVNGFEQIDIRSHIYDALYRNFNARKVDYGYEIPYETLLSVIENADNRIKSVMLDEPSMTTKVLVRRRINDSWVWKEEDFIGNSGNISEDFKYYTDMLAKNIVAGRVPMFTYDEDFVYQYGEYAATGVETPIYKNIKSITTSFNARAASDGKISLPLNENETVQLVAPAYGVSLAYVSGVCYSWTGHQGDITIADDKGRYEIQPGEELRLYYEEGSNKILVRYTSNMIYKKVNGGVEDETEVEANYIRPSAGFTLSPTEENSKNASYIMNDEFDRWTPPDKDTPHPAGYYKFYGLATKEEIQILDRIETTHKDKAMPCYWLLNTNENALFTADCYVEDKDGLHVYERILAESEFFMWSNEQLTDLEVIGSGTKITYKTAVAPENIEEHWKLDKSIGPNAEEVSDAGLAAFAGYPWKYINFSSNPITFTQMDILTLTAGDEIVNLTLADPSVESLGNTFERVTGDFVYKILTDGEEAQSSLDLTQNVWKAKTRLDLNAGPSIRQLLNVGDIITINYFEMVDGEPVDRSVDIQNCYVKFNTALQLTGGINLDMKSVDLDGKESYPLKALVCQYTEPTYTVSDGDARSLLENQNNEIEISYKLWAKEHENITLRFLHIPNELSLVCIYSSNDEMEVHVLADDTISYYNETGEGSSGTRLLVRKGTNIFDVTNVEHIELELTPPAGVESGDEDEITGALCVGRITHPIKLNDRFFKLPLFKDEEEAGSSVYRNAVETLIKNKVRPLGQITDTSGTHNIFDYVAVLDNSKAIEVEDLSSSLALFDVNNICNKFTIAQIAIAQKAEDSEDEDFYSEISIARASKL